MLTPRALLLALVLGATAAVGCAAPPIEAGEDQGEALRQIQAQDVNEVLVENVRVVQKPGADVAPALKRVASWTLRHVEYRDAANPEKQDELEPFRGYFLVANDADGNALFLDAISIVDKDGLEGSVHSFFSFASRANQAGIMEYEELPLAPGEDAASQARSKATHAWLAAQRATVADALRARFGATDAQTTSLHTLGLDKLQAMKCAADIALLVLTVTNPITGFLLQAGADGAFALIQAASGQGGTESALDATAGVALAGVAKGAEMTITRSVAASILVVAGGAKVAVLTAAVGATGYVGVQMWKKGVPEGGASGMKDIVKLLVPTSCQKAYASMQTQ